jgi:hypothetical protein
MRLVKQAGEHNILKRIKTAATERNLIMNGSGKIEEGKTRVTARLIDIVCDMTIDQQLELLQQLDKQKFKSGRADHRRSRKIAVDYEIDNHIHRDFIQDISSAGAFIETTRPPAIGGNITLTFSLSSNKKPIRITGQIVRSDDRGFAVDFKRIERG